MQAGPQKFRSGHETFHQGSNPKTATPTEVPT
jgi:hypothetical protein